MTPENLAMQKAAYSHISGFDLDHSLMSANSSAHFGLYLFRQKVIPFGKMMRLISYYGRHRWGTLSLERLHGSIFDSFFKGQNSNLIAQHIPQFLNLFLQEKRYLPLCRRLKEAKEAGHFVCLLSSSPQFLIAPIAQSFAFDGYLATQYSCDEKGHFQSVEKLVDGQAKASFLHALAKQMHLPLSATSAYSDSILDLPFLLAAGKAVGVKPDRKLRAHCLKRNWEIL